MCLLCVLLRIEHMLYVLTTAHLRLEKEHKKLQQKKYPVPSLPPSLPPPTRYNIIPRELKRRRRRLQTDKTIVIFGRVRWKQ